MSEDRIPFPVSHYDAHFRSSVPYLCAVFALLILWLPVCGLAAQEPPLSFSELRRTQQRDGFRQVLQWLRTNPDHPEYFDAARWCLESAFDRGWYSDAADISRTILENHASHKELRKLASKVKTLGLAAEGSDEALAEFAEHLKQVRVRHPNESLQFAFALCAQFQINGDQFAAREILRATSDAFFLNEQVRTLCDRRTARLLLADKPAPKLQWTTIAGSTGSLADLRGKIVLVEFWATDCAPCLADLPRLKEVYGRFQSRGFEIVGLSLDRTANDVQVFRSKHNVRWPLALVADSPDSPRDAYRVVTIPSSFLIDRQGNVALVDGTARDIGLMLETLTASE